MLAVVTVRVRVIAMGGLWVERWGPSMALIWVVSMADDLVGGTAAVSAVSWAA